MAREFDLLGDSEARELLEGCLPEFEKARAELAQLEPELNELTTINDMANTLSETAHRIKVLTRLGVLIAEPGYPLRYVRGANIQRYVCYLRIVALAGRMVGL